ncbi:hypothetical protein G7Y79_00003g010140 [Physcia stellaris]|nr:hypothetical protein G7Y79_00003g010140 [Physcia stellaris]
MEIDNDEPTGVAPPSDPPLSKNKLKKLKRDQQWEAGRELRKKIRKEKLKEKKLKKRAAREEAAPPPPSAAIDEKVTIVIDCGFDDLMQVHERKSLGSQVTRCYSDNHKAPYQAHLVISSFGGHLKERFDTLLSGNHRSWKGVRFLEEDFNEAAKQAKEWMKAPDGGTLAGALAHPEPLPHDASSEQAAEGEVVYLTSDSPHTLSCLRPYCTYIIGGIVDKNRHKGICYKKAMEAGVKTAKLPIGDYMQMNSRFVLATNHVSEIMVRWLESGDWGVAFDRVVPKRKGGVLKGKEAVVSELKEEAAEEKKYSESISELKEEAEEEKKYLASSET